MSLPLLEIEGLGVTFHTRGGLVPAVRDVSLSIDRGEVLGVVGESGSGKSVTMQAVMGLVDPPGFIEKGDIRWKGNSLFSARASSLRGSHISMIFQDAMTSLDPLMPVGDQIMEGLFDHLGLRRKQARQRAIELLAMVGIPTPETRLSHLPHEFSGGMRQRIMIAMALAVEPELLIADEPTTALDVTVQAQIVDLLLDLQHRLALSLVLVTHDLGLVAEICDRVAVMYAGRIVEIAPVNAIFAAPAHPYTQGLLASTPRIDGEASRLATIAGSPVNAASLPEGCAFRPRCPRASEACVIDPGLVVMDTVRRVACWHPLSAAEVAQ